MCMTSQPSGYPSDPAHRPTVAKLTGFKRRERTFDRSQLLCFQWIYERTGARHALFRLRTHVEARSAPGRRSLGHGPSKRSRAAVGRCGDDVVGAPGLERLARAEIAPGGDDGAHAGGPAGLHVAQVVADVDACRRRHAEPARRLEQRRRMRLGVRRRVAADQRAGALGAGRARATSGAVKRVALLVTMPQAMPAASSAPSSGGIVGEDARLAASCAAS